MDLGLKNKVAFIAASSDGLGKAVAIEMAKEGAQIIINGRNKEKLALTKLEIEQKFDVNVLAIQGDLSKTEDRALILQTIFNNYEIIPYCFLDWIFR